MNKTVLISIQPKWCELIASGRKTIEVRKTVPKFDAPFKCYIYCTKDTKKHYYIDEYGDSQVELIPTKVIGEFVCDRIYEIEPYNTFDAYWWNFDFNIQDTCLSENKLEKYLLRKNKEISIAERGYGWHISDLKIYDTPKELGEFRKAGYMTEEQWLYALYPNTHCHYAAWAKRFEIKHAPQSWCYVEELNA